ncbi:MAG: hypothetical protein OES28_07580 [Desulfobulbaceae bacterium]|nr:hypothetical protein [Desulfobulbaceae bacterium]
MSDTKKKIHCLADGCALWFASETIPGHGSCSMRSGSANENAKEMAIAMKVGRQ